MKGYARAELVNTIEGVGLTVNIPTTEKKTILSVVEHSLKKESETLLDIAVNVRGKIISAHHGQIVLSFIESPLLRLETVTTRRSSNQNSTLRGIERFMFYAENGYEPAGKDTYWIHEGLIEKYSTWVTNPRTNISLPKRTSDPSMSTTEMAKIVQGALDELASMDIPETVLKSIGHDMKTLWDNWYKWRYGQDKDPLYEIENAMNWEQYKEIHPVCELCGLKGVDSNPLERMHIITGGSDIGNYEMPWNWLAAHRSHHNLQHNEGWEIIEKSFPHIVGKLKRARLMQGKGEGIENN